MSSIGGKKHTGAGTKGLYPPSEVKSLPGKPVTWALAGLCPPSEVKSSTITTTTADLGWFMSSIGGKKSTTSPFHHPAHERLCPPSEVKSSATGIVSRLRGSLYPTSEVKRTESRTGIGPRHHRLCPPSEVKRLVVEMGRWSAVKFMSSIGGKKIPGLCLGSKE